MYKCYVVKEGLYTKTTLFPNLKPIIFEYGVKKQTQTHKCFSKKYFKWDFVVKKK
jgi:hypothetical protein